MRYCMVDRFLEFERGRRAVAVKNVTLSDDLTTEYQPGQPFMAPSMLLESIAQAAGILLMYSLDNAGQAMLAKVNSFKCIEAPRPGDQIIIEVILEDIRDEGCRVNAVAKVNSNVVAESIFLLAIVPSDVAPKEFREQSERRLRAFYPELLTAETK
ncbi:MAG TPA: beta-hydroxyacyl-ACP dehydratase [Blastocatellia bacterium]|nr:beta-hydroxyacyl-ACP dehydratase [Blastocatellia bacterium]